ncbi:MAG: hypothetical protein JOZ31_02965 [Verrucomicrobia bacterium]|nr:hypothetical protein [Verrucomicrobiota bacterium]MBV8481703.1 hypothetical protein [Verrucomicrobiota bacterium]
MLAAVLWGIKQRSGLPAVPLLTPDSWGYLHPALSWLGGAGFQQTDGRAWFYPAILTLILKVGGDFSGIVRIQQVLGLASAPLLWFGLRIWLSLCPKRTAVCHGVAVFLGATTAAIYLLNTTQVRFEMTIQPEGVLAFFVLAYLLLGVAYIRMRWVSHEDFPATVFGAATLLASYCVLLLKPSWGFALIPSFLLLVAGIFGAGSRSLRWIPAFAAVVATGGLFIFPHLLGFRPDSGSRTFLPFTLVSIHAAQIVQNAEKEHLITETDSSRRSGAEAETASPDEEDQFYQELKQTWIEARKVPLGCPTLGFAPDYIMYTKDFFRGFAAEQKLTDSELIRLCYTTYFKTWMGSPAAMLAKIGKELRIFLSAPSRDFAAHSVSRKRALDISARFSPSPQDLLTAAESKDYLRNQPAYLAYLANLANVYRQGWQIDCVNWLRYLAIVLAKLASIIQIAFFVALIPIFLTRRLSDLRLPALAATMISTAVYGNMLTVGVVHTLDLDRYRTGYVPALLLTLAIMTTVLFAVAERRRPRKAADQGQTWKRSNGAPGSLPLVP